MQGQIWVGSTFNIQNFIPHKSQKPKAVAEINRPKEFQRGTVGAAESAKECDSVLPEGSDIGLGAGCRGFKSLHSDQKGSKLMLSSLFLMRFFASAQKNLAPSNLMARGFRFQNGKPMGVSLLIASLVAFSLCVIASLTAATIIS